MVWCVYPHHPKALLMQLVVAPVRNWMQPRTGVCLLGVPGGERDIDVPPLLIPSLLTLPLCLPLIESTPVMLTLMPPLVVIVIVIVLVALQEGVRVEWGPRGGLLSVSVAVVPECVSVRVMCIYELVH